MHWRTLSIDGHEIFISAEHRHFDLSLGRRHREALLKNADTAMYHAKEQGGTTASFIPSGLNAAAAERLDLETNSVAPWNGKSLSSSSAEAEHPFTQDTGRGSARPLETSQTRPGAALGVFLNAAIDTGLIRPMDEWVFLRTCRQVKAWETKACCPSPCRPTCPIPVS
ncbi:MAG: hypothetical protein IPM88_19825 [Nitrospira sp.]|nr:hypothetical protein [Nitrospira sp.]